VNIIKKVDNKENTLARKIFKKNYIIPLKLTL